jgi:hypothetical protein
MSHHGSLLVVRCVHLPAAHISIQQTLPVMFDLLVHAVFCSVQRRKRSPWHESEHLPDILLDAVLAHGVFLGAPVRTGGERHGAEGHRWGVRCKPDRIAWLFASVLAWRMHGQIVITILDDTRFALVGALTRG